MKFLKHILFLLLAFLGLFQTKLEAKLIVLENGQRVVFAEEDFKEVSTEKEWLGLLHLQKESANQFSFSHFLSGSLFQNSSGELCLKNCQSSHQSNFPTRINSTSHLENGGWNEDVFHGNPQLVNSWEKLFKEGIPSTVRTNPTYLSAVSKQLTKYGDDVVFQFDRVPPNVDPSNYDRFFTALDNPKSIDHVRSLVGDFENIPGISSAKYVSNSLPVVDIPAPGTWADPLLELGGETAETFSSVTAKTLSPGQKLYRVLGEGQRKSVGFWTYELPKTKADLYGGTAVRPEWNNGTSFVEYTVPEGGLKIWDGPTASQRVIDDVDDFMLEGGSTQIFIPDKVRADFPDLPINNMIWD